MIKIKKLVNVKKVHILQILILNFVMIVLITPSAQGVWKFKSIQGIGEAAIQQIQFNFV